MIRLALIGAGNHCRLNHAPALSKYAADHPDKLELAAVCDLDLHRAETCADQFGFKSAYTDYVEMLEREKPDGCVCVMPVQLIANLTIDLMRRGVPITLEKPPGATLEEARQLLSVARETGTPHMVSVNRRFEPLLRRAISWAKERGPLRYVRASILRHNRREPDFVYGTAIHCIDALRAIGGEISNDLRRIHKGDPNWFNIAFEFTSSALGTLDVLTSCGSLEERYELFGENYRVDAQVGPSAEPRVRGWDNGKLTLDERPPENQPEFIRVGPYAETHEFVTALSEGRLPWPSVEEIYPSVEIATRLDPSIL